MPKRCGEVRPDDIPSHRPATEPIVCVRTGKAADNLYVGTSTDMLKNVGARLVFMNTHPTMAQSVLRAGGTANPTPPAQLRLMLQESREMVADGRPRAQDMIVDGAATTVPPPLSPKRGSRCDSCCSWMDGASDGDVVQEVCTVGFELK